VLVSADVLGVSPALELNTRVNGRVVQHDNTRNMTHDVAKIVSALLTGMFFHLLPEVLGASRRN
jgi:2-keto-4-pentenoate hydratase/2-oxohepta-3-ene-1,7-dioic acid hydratase in catechol pathway